VTQRSASQSRSAGAGCYSPRSCICRHRSSSMHRRRRPSSAHARYFRRARDIAPKPDLRLGGTSRLGPPGPGRRRPSRRIPSRHIRSPLARLTRLARLLHLLRLRPVRGQRSGWRLARRPSLDHRGARLQRSRAWGVRHRSAARAYVARRSSALATRALRRRRSRSRIERVAECGGLDRDSIRVRSSSRLRLQRAMRQHRARARA